MNTTPALLKLYMRYKVLLLDSLRNITFFDNQTGQTLAKT